MKPDLFEEESNLIRKVLEPEEILEIVCLSETDSSLDISLIVTPDEYIQAYVRPLSRIGYTFDPNESSPVKLSFNKGETFKYHLSLAQAN